MLSWHNFEGMIVSWKPVSELHGLGFRVGSLELDFKQVAGDKMAFHF